MIDLDAIKAQWASEIAWAEGQTIHERTETTTAYKVRVALTVRDLIADNERLRGALSSLADACDPYLPQP